MKLATSKDMKKIDEMAVQSHGLSIETLMEAAGNSVAEALEAQWGLLSKKTVGILCGKGHNGGDGLAAARFLKAKKASVVAVIIGEAEDLAEETLKQFLKAKAAKVPILGLTDSASLKSIQVALEECDILVDALLGTGLSRAPEGLYRELIQLARGLGKPVAAVDVPSGMSADSGMPPGEVLPAQMTVTFGLPKIGFYTPMGSSLTGKVTVEPIGFPQELLNASFIKQEVSDAEMVRKALPRYDENTHKGTRGRLVVVAGATGLTGAAVLSAIGAQRIGAGLVTVACAESLNPILASKLTECMTAPVPEVEGGFLSLKATGRILHLTTNVNAVVIGPGIGRHRETGQLLRDLLTKLTVPMVVDADALNLLGGQLDIFRAVKPSVILTPHPGEAAWLLKTSINEVEQNRVKVAKQIAESYNVTVVLKGRFTVIASPQGELRINPTGNRGLATAGTGDVLAGMIGGLLAQRLPAFEAATTGVFLHGLAGERASQRLGPDGLMAGDLLPVLPRLLRQMRENHQEKPWPSPANSKTNGTPSSASSKSGNRASTTT
ncbi:MAG TPA: NAD(P)H-hydrate dehydratase [bacterium]|nr:NAD(P)H-hydrate dehydratase [bacterium]